MQITVEAGIFPRINTLVSADVSEQVKNDLGHLSLTEVKDGKTRPVPSQLVFDGDKVLLIWVMTGETKVGESRIYTLLHKKSSGAVAMRVEDKNGAITLKKNGAKVISYVHKITMPPAGADPAYQRSGFIHPAYSPSGNVLTTIQPKDHYHHYGIWNPWTHLDYQGKIYDLWNLRDKQGTVRYEKTIEMKSGVMAAGFKVIHNHILFTSQGEKNVMNEEVDVKTYNTPGKEMIWDFKSTLMPVEKVAMRPYRYGGFGYRACEEWTNKNSIMVNSEGRSRQQIDNTTGRWIYTEGVCKNGTKSGILFLGFPKNRKYPEPFRIWNEKANGGRGDVFINFAPTKLDDWELEPGGSYVLRYRMISYDGEMTPDRAEAMWQDFAYPPYVKISQ